MNLKNLKIKDSADNKTLLAVQEAINNSPNPVDAETAEMGGYVEATEVGGSIQIEEAFGFMSDELKQQVESILEADGYSVIDTYSNHDSNYTLWSK